MHELAADAALRMAVGVAHFLISFGCLFGLTKMYEMVAAKTRK
jgi:hypothetical protein